MKDKVTMSRGNVFADIGLPDAEERLAKAQLANKIAGIIQKRHISRAEAARILGTEQLLNQNRRVVNLLPWKLFSPEPVYRGKQ